MRKISLNKEKIQQLKKSVKENKRIMVIAIMVLLYIIGEIVIVIIDVDFLWFMMYCIPYFLAVLICVGYCFYWLILEISSLFIVERKVVKE